MANDEHVEILRKGVEAWNAWRKENPEVRPDLEDANLGDADLEAANLMSANLMSANLRGANLGNANLEDAKLRSASLVDAHLRHAKLRSADLGGPANLGDAHHENAHLKDADLKDALLEAAEDLARADLGAYLRSADLRGADLGNADLVGAKLSGAKLSGANLENAELWDAKLASADLENADLRRAKGYRLDANHIRGMKISRNARDPWSVLRRNYTGPRFVFHLLLLAVFVVPYLAKTLMWVGVNRSQAVMVEAQAQIKATATLLEAAEDPTAATLRQLAGNLGELKPCLAAECREYRVWQLLVGVDKGPRFWVLGLFLLLYNAGRGLLTWKVGPLRDETEQSGYSPALSDYMWLYRVHRVVVVLLVVALVSLGYHAWEWLWNTTVWIPAV